MQALMEKLRRPLEGAMILMLFLMIALTFADVLGRKLLSKPVYGAHDLTEHLMALIVFAGLPLSSVLARHMSASVMRPLILALCGLSATLLFLQTAL